MMLASRRDCVDVDRRTSVRWTRAISFVVRGVSVGIVCWLAAMCVSNSALDSKAAVQPLTGQSDKS